MQLLDLDLQGFALGGREVGVEHRRLVGEAVPIVSDDAAVAEEGLERTSLRTRNLPSRLFTRLGLPRILRLFLRGIEAQFRQPGRGRDLGGLDRRPLPILAAGAEAIILRQSHETRCRARDEFVFPLVAVRHRVRGMRRGEGFPSETWLSFPLGALLVDTPRRAAVVLEVLDERAGRIDRAARHRAALEPGLHAVVQRPTVIRGQTMQHDGRAVRANREGRRRHARIGLPLLVLSLRGGHILGLHLEMLVRIRAAGIEHQTGDSRIADGRTRPEVRREETDRPLEVRRVQEERPAVVAGGDVLAFGLRLGLRERHREVTITEELAVDALLEVEAVRREEQPRRQLRDAVEPARVFPGASSVGRPVGDVVKVHAHAAHDELRRRGREMRVAPPAETTLDIIIKVLGLLSQILRVHPRAEEAGLEAMARVLLQERPSRGVDREASVVAVRHALGRDDQVAGHLDSLRGGRKRRCHQAGDQECGGSHGTN